MKKTLAQFAFWVGLPGLFRRLNANKIAVLMYHGVVPDDAREAEDDWLQVRAGEFRRQMEYLKRHYEVCSFTGALQSGLRVSAKPRVIVTFDDGYASNCAVAFPILQELGIPAVVFVVTGMVDTDNIFWWDRLFHSTKDGRRPDPNTSRTLKELHPHVINERLDEYLRRHGFTFPSKAPPLYRALTSAEITEMAASGLIEFGSHTHGHEILSRLEDEETETTVRTSVERLRALGLRVRSFAAPSGDYEDAHIPILQKLGLEVIVGVQERLWDVRHGSYRIPRFGIGRGCSLPEFACTISGFRELARRYKMRFPLMAALAGAVASILGE